MYKKVELSSDLARLSSTLKEGFPGTQHAWQIVREIESGKLEANIFTDQWPAFTTVITQEFSPRLSEIADIRIYTSAPTKVVPLLKDANLLQNTGNWQMIHYMLSKDECKQLTDMLLEFLRHYPGTKDKTSELVFDNAAFRPIHNDNPQTAYHVILPMPSELQIKNIPVECADYVAKHWVAPATIEYPLEHRTRFIREVLTRYEILGVYTSDNPSYPVAFTGQKPGGVIGLSFTHPDYRHYKINTNITLELGTRMFENGVKIFSETKEENVQKKRIGLENTFGSSQIIAIY